MRRLLSAALGAFVLVADGCSTTTASIDHVWRAPDARPGELTNVVVMFPSTYQDLRRAVEDKLAQQMVARGMRAVPAYAVLTAEDVVDRDRAAHALARAGYDGVVATRFVDATHTLEYYPSFDLYWGAAWGSAIPRTVVRMQIDAYALDDRRLMWTATSNSVDPSDVEQLVDDVTKVASRELDHQRVVLARK